MPDRVRLVLVGDWGTGLPRAQAVAAQMRIKIDEALAQGVSVHVIHLGDVYYSGWGREYKKRFLPYWPVRAGEAQRVGSWCLNANHDMYSGGYGYFGDALGDPRFAAWQNDGHKPTSFFSLVNAHWKILGLDTGWDNAGLKDPQNQWLEDELRSAGGRKTLLLSHHQLFSAFDEVASTLVKKVTPILSRNPVTAWFWGHEHRCMSFAAHANVKFGRCVGDGGVPVYQWHKESDPYPPPGLYEHRRFILNGLERWAYMGFAVLDLTNDKIEAKYVDDKGIEHRRETIS
ncbi:MAG TPA: metallophosphoesterase [Phycisphaerae bacterium]|nr:metallophosphoesterase [Phycisphaerae bacterium]